MNKGERTCKVDISDPNVGSGPDGVTMAAPELNLGGPTLDFP